MPVTRCLTTAKLCPTVHMQQDYLKSLKIDVSTKSLDASLYLTDDFPLPSDRLFDILELVSPASSELAQVCTILRSVPSESFPARFVMPIVSGINAEVTTSKYQQMTPDDDLFLVPTDFTRII